MVNNVTGGALIMGGTDNTITIPAVCISLEDGNNIKAQLALGNTVNVTLKAGIAIGLDGDLDAGVMCHEYTHGISNRLTGGPSNTGCLTNAEQMGEGWSDYNALMVTTNWATAQITDGPKKRPLGTYVFSQTPTGTGIRLFPYRSAERRLGKGGRSRWSPYH